MFRTPGAPIEQLCAWSELADTGAAGEDRSRRRLADGLVDASRSSFFLAALSLASPDLLARMDAWRAAPLDPAQATVLRAVSRYFVRMCARATPYGLFAGCARGRVAERTDLAVLPRAQWRRVSRLDMDALSQMSRRLGEDQVLLRVARLRRNPTLVRIGDRWHAVETRVDGRKRRHHLVAFVSDDYLELVIDACTGEASLADLVDRLVAHDPEIAPDEAQDYVADLIRSEVLLTDLDPIVTGGDAGRQMLATLQGLGVSGVDESPLVQALAKAVDAMAAMDATSVDVVPVGDAGSATAYERISASLNEAGLDSDPARVVQVDLFTGADVATLGQAHCRDVLAGVEVLAHLAPPPQEGALADFRRRFQDRWGEAEVPLSEVIDEEHGIGFLRSDSPAAGESPLLAGLPFAGGGAGGQPAPAPAFRHILDRTHAAWSSGAHVMEIDADEVKRLAGTLAEPLPDAFAAILCVLPGGDAGAPVGPSLLLQGFSGPSGATLTGRFTHLDPSLLADVREHLVAEEACRPEAIFAEIVHLPEGRIGNVIARPLLRSHEIALLGRSGAAADQVIPVADLMVSIQGSRIVLRSRALGREVIPRLSTAHNYMLPAIGLYRFLCVLQGQGVLAGGGWQWGPLASARFLPRVVCGRVVLERASWRVDRKELDGLLDDVGCLQPAAFATWRAARDLPDWVELAEGDNVLLADLRNPLLVEMILDRLVRIGGGRLREALPTPEAQVAVGADGRYAHEIVLPFTRQIVAADETATRAIPRQQATVAPVSRRAALSPGGDWLYAKLYAGEAELDRLCLDLVAPLVASLPDGDDAPTWFFIRYADPEPHLRLRIAASRHLSAPELLARLHEQAAPLLDGGRLRKLVLDAYEPETDRYGGPEALPFIERWFRHDSEAALTLVAASAGASGSDLRWRLALVGARLILDDFGFGPEPAQEILRAVDKGYRAEFATSRALDGVISRRFRDHRPELEALLARAGAEEVPAELAPLRRRTERTRTLVAALLALAGEDRLAAPLPDILASLMHMHINRLLRAHPRAHERVIYEYLARLGQSDLARRRAGVKAGQHA